MISNPTVCNISVFHAVVFGEMKLFAVLSFFILNISRCHIGREERRFTGFFLLLFGFAYGSFLHRSVYPLYSLATFLTSYFFKQLSILNANAVSSGKQYSQSRYGFSQWVYTPRKVSKVKEKGNLG